MQWIKAHLNVVIAGSVSFLALVAVVLGFVLPNPVGAMSADQSLVTSLPGANGAPLSAIEARRQEQLKNRTVLKSDQDKFVADKSKREPLPSGVYLFPKENPNNQTAPFEFKQEFQKKRQELLNMLNAQDQPTATEISEVTEAMTRAKAQKVFEEGTGAGKDKTKQPEPPTPTGPTTPRPTQFTMGGGGAFQQLPPDATPEQRMAEDPMTRAAVNKARRIWCYASPDSLDPRPAIGPEVLRPTLDDMWYAQVSLWVQEDILSALARLNKEAAAQLPAGESPWVGNLPFKHLRSFILGGYVPAAAAPGAAAGGGYGGGGGGGDIGGPPPMDSNLVMSKHGTTDAVDRIQFTLDMVIDAKALPRVINAVSSAGFYTILQISYEAMPPNTTLYGYIYGPQPVIHVWMVVEGSLLRNKYEKLMPDSVKADIKAGKPVGGGGTGSAASPGGPPMGMPGRMMPGGGGPAFERRIPQGRQMP